MLRGLVTRQFFVLVDVTLAVIIAYVAYLVIDRLTQSGRLNTSSRDVEAAQPDVSFARVGPRDQYNVILENRLFGEAAAIQAAPEPSAPEPPKETTAVTRRPLTLRGTSFADARPNAVIEYQGQSKVFRLDDEVIPGEVALKEVHNRWVLLLDKKSNQTERLYMASKDAPAGMASGYAPGSMGGGGSPLGGRPQAANQVTLRREEVATELEHMTANLAEIAGQVNPQPVTNDQGKVIGYTADALHTIPLAQKIGLQDGDVVTQVNGRPVDSMERLTEIINQYQNADTFRITLLRDGKPKIITFKLE